MFDGFELDRVDVGEVTLRVPGELRSRPIHSGHH
jgi:hypothetical protein